MAQGFDSNVREDRFSRLRLISWWDQEKIAKRVQHENAEKK